MECGMLSFASTTDYYDTYTCLETALEDYQEDLESQYSSLNDDQLDSAIEANGQDWYQPLIDFETAANLFSFRAAYASAEEQWLAGGGDPANIPAVDPFHNDVKASMRNKYGAVMINGLIYLTDSQHNNWVFCSCDEYQGYIADPVNYDPTGNPCVEVVTLRGEFTVNGNTCHDNWYQCKDTTYANGRRVTEFLVCSFLGGTMGTEYASEIKHYEWKNNRWKYKSAKIYAKVYGDLNSGECLPIQNIFREKPLKRRRKRVAFDWTGSYRSFEDGKVLGGWQFAGNANGFALEFIGNQPSQCP